MSSPTTLELKIKTLVEGLSNVQILAEELRDVGKGASDGAKVAESGADRIANAYKTLGARSFGEIKAEIAKVKAAYGELANSGQLSSQELGVAAKSAETKIAGLTHEMQGVAPATKNADRGMASLSGAIAGLVIGFATVAAAIAGIKEASKAAIELDRVNSAMIAVTGSSEGAAREMAFVRSEASRLGLDLQKTAKDYAALMAATKGTNLEGQKTRAIFTSIAEASTVLGLSADQTSGVLTAVQQMISKGTVSAEELRGQLGDRLPGSFQIAARAMGVTTAELGKMLEAGGIATDTFLPKFAAEMTKTFSGGLPTAIQAPRVELKKLETQIFETAASVGNSGLNQGLAEAAKILREKLADPQVQAELKKIGALIGDIAVFVARASSELGTLAAIFTGNYFFKKWAADLIALGTASAAAAAGQTALAATTATAGTVAAASVPAFATLTAAVGGFVSVLALVAPYVVGLVALYQATKAVASAIVEYALENRKLTEFEKERATQLKESNAQLRTYIQTHQQYADVQIKSAKELLALEPAQISAYKAQLEAKKALEAAEHKLALQMQDLEVIRAQEAKSLGKSRAEIEGHIKASQAAGAEAAKLAESLGVTRKALADLGDATKKNATAMGEEMSQAGQKLVAAFDGAIDKGQEVAKALGEVFKGFNANNLESVKAVVEAFAAIEKKGAASAVQVRTAFEKEINSLDYKGLINLQTLLDGMGDKGVVAAGLVVQALGKVSDAAREAADVFVRMNKQAVEAAASAVSVAKAHLDVVKADIEVKRASLDVVVKHNAYVKEGTTLSRLEYELAKTNLEIQKQKLIETKLQFEVAKSAREVLIKQQQQLNAEINIELHRGEAIYVQKARQAQANTEAAKAALSVATVAASKQQEITLALEEQGANQQFLVEKAKVAEEETKKIKANMDDAAAATEKAANSMGNFANASNKAQSSTTSSKNFNQNGSSNQGGNQGGNQTYFTETIESLTKKFQEAGLSYAGARVSAEKLVDRQLYVDIDAEIQKAKELIDSGKRNNSDAKTGNYSGGSLNVDSNSNEFNGRTVSSQNLLNQLPKPSSSSDIGSDINTVVKPSKTIQVNFTNANGAAIPMTMDANNEAALLDLLKRAKGVAT